MSERRPLMSRWAQDDYPNAAHLAATRGTDGWVEPVRVELRAMFDELQMARNACIDGNLGDLGRLRDAYQSDAGIPRRSAQGILCGHGRLIGWHKEGVDAGLAVLLEGRLETCPHGCFVQADG